MRPAASRWSAYSEKALRKEPFSAEEALRVLCAPDEETLDLLQAAYQVRKHFKGNRVRVHVLQNAKSGACPEDCAFCSQSSRYKTPAPIYKLQSVEEIMEGAKKAKEAGAWKYCIVTATRAPSDRDLDVLCEAVRRIKKEFGLKICTSLGLLTPEKAKRLAEAGVDRFNHNLETSRRFYPSIVRTHSWEDRLQTARIAREAGMEVCSGGIIGMGETPQDVVDLCFSLREVDVASIPVNFLDPRPGTPLSHLPLVPPLYALRVLCLFRFVHPDRDIRAAGGREVTFRSLQSFVLYPANSIFTNGYLTTGGQEADRDLQMIQDAGFVPEIASLEETGEKEET